MSAQRRLVGTAQGTSSSLLTILAGIVLAGTTPSNIHAQTSYTAPVEQSKLAPAPGVDSVLDARVKSVASHLRCPVCQGESIQDSPAELAGQMKLLVREQLAAGKSEREVSDYFVQKYGQWILLEPRAEGFNLLVYWLPVFFIVLGGAGIWIAVKRWTRPLPPVDVTAPASDAHETFTS